MRVHRGGGEARTRTLPASKNSPWGWMSPTSKSFQLAAAIAAFENEHPLMEISSLQIDSGKDNIQYQTARLTVGTVIKQ